MSSGLYMDEHVSRAITLGLRRRGIDVLTVQEDDRIGISDQEVIERPTNVGRILFSQDDDLLVEATERQKANVPFSGVVYGHQVKLTIGEAVDDLELIAQATEPGGLMNTVVYLPL